MIMELVQRYGTKWSKIVKLMPGRTDNAIKNRWNSTMRKNLRRQLKEAGGSELYITTRLRDPPVSTMPPAPTPLVPVMAPVLLPLPQAAMPAVPPALLPEPLPAMETAMAAPPATDHAQPSQPPSEAAPPSVAAPPPLVLQPSLPPPEILQPSPQVQTPSQPPTQPPAQTVQTPQQSSFAKLEVLETAPAGPPPPPIELRKSGLAISCDEIASAAAAVTAAAYH